MRAPHQLIPCLLTLRLHMRVDAKLFTNSMEAVWQRVKADAPLVASLPTVLHPSAPYQRADGTNLECNVIVAGGMLPPEPDSRQCRFQACERSVVSGALRVHIGCHVLKMNEQHPNHQCEPCGYCGDSTSGCIATITETDPIKLKPCAPKCGSAGLNTHIS